MAQFGNAMSTGLSDHVQRVMMAKRPIIDQGHHLEGIANQVQEGLDGLLDATERRRQHHVSSLPMLTASRAAPFPMGGVLAPCSRRFCVRLVPLFHEHRIRGAACDAHQGHTPQTEPGDPCPREGGKKPLQSMCRLARCRHDHFVTAHHDHIVVISQRVSDQQPLSLAPVQTGREETLERPRAAPLTGPARHAPHRHTARHRQHRFGHPTEVADRGTIKTLASTGEKDHTIPHGRLLLG